MEQPATVNTDPRHVQNKKICPEMFIKLLLKLCRMLKMLVKQVFVSLSMSVTILACGAGVVCSEMVYHLIPNELWKFSQILQVVGKNQKQIPMNMLFLERKDLGRWEVGTSTLYLKSFLKQQVTTYVIVLIQSSGYPILINFLMQVLQAISKIMGKSHCGPYSYLNKHNCFFANLFKKIQLLKQVVKLLNI